MHIQIKYFSLIIPLILSACNAEPESLNNVNPVQTDSEMSALTDTNTLEADTLQLGACTFLISQSPDTVLFQGIDIFERTDEAQLLSNDNQVERVGDSLIFKLANGKELIIFDIPINQELDNMDASKYTFQGTISTSNYWELYAVGYEWSWYVVINKTNGITQWTKGKPTLSPNGQLLLCANGDLEARYTVNGFELFNVGKDSIELIGENELKEWGPYAVKWQGNSNILITKGIMGDATNQYRLKYSNILLSMDSASIESLH